PPSPGLLPCAILICSSSADRRYAGVTPKRADATCLVRLPSAWLNRSGSSPPSPLLLRAPIWFIARATMRCASGDSAPTDIADAKNRRQIFALDEVQSVETICRRFCALDEVQSVETTVRRPSRHHHGER